MSTALESRRLGEQEDYNAAEQVILLSYCTVFLSLWPSRRVGCFAAYQCLHLFTKGVDFLRCVDTDRVDSARLRRSSLKLLEAVGIIALAIYCPILGAAATLGHFFVLRAMTWATDRHPRHFYAMGTHLLSGLALFSPSPNTLWTTHLASIPLWLLGEYPVARWRGLSLREREIPRSMALGHMVLLSMATQAWLPLDLMDQLAILVLCAGLFKGIAAIKAHLRGTLTLRQCALLAASLLAGCAFLYGQVMHLHLFSFLGIGLAILQSYYTRTVPSPHPNSEELARDLAEERADHRIGLEYANSR